jgi:hypothetical protein
MNKNKLVCYQLLKYVQDTDPCNTLSDLEHCDQQFFPALLNLSHAFFSSASQKNGAGGEGWTVANNGIV